MRCQKVLRSSPAGRMTTSPEGEVMHLPGVSLVSHNKRQEHHGSAQTARPRFLPPCLRKTKTQRSASGCTSGSPCCADMNPGGAGGVGSHRTTSSGSTFSIFRKINEQALSKRLACLPPHCLSRPPWWGSVII